MDWLKPELSGSVLVADLFKRVFRLTELGPNNIRPEIVVRAFAAHVYAFGAEVYTTLGAQSEVALAVAADACRAMSRWRVIGFRLYARRYRRVVNFDPALVL